MTTMTAPRPAADPWQPIYGDQIGPTRAQRTRSALLLVLLLVVLGTLLAAAIGVAVIAVLALFGASFG